ncbi:MAG: hypothetical protein HGB18_05195 [Candidatus Moranbacteria bacterium]|nr:hypothetical protein [Candidatus Moranbacteria bacterium]
MTKENRERNIRALTGLVGQEKATEIRDMPSVRMLVPAHFIRLIGRLRADGDEAGAVALLKTVIPSIEEGRADVPIPHGIDGMGSGYHLQEFALPDHEQPWTIRRLYPDRVILIVSLSCAGICRYCFRKSESGHTRHIHLAPALDYIRAWNTSREPKIRDVILSGGDPLSLSDTKLDEILTEVWSISGVECVRLDTKYPVTRPKRITKRLLDILDGRVNIVTVHATHPAEISEEMSDACRRMARRGIVLRSHTPLLRGINDNRETLKRLFWDLFSKCGVTPLYAIQFVETPGAAHFRIPLSESFELMRGMQNELSGPAVPNFIIYLPDGGGKYDIGPFEDIDRIGIRKVEGGYEIPSPLFPGKHGFYPD